MRVPMGDFRLVDGGDEKRATKDGLNVEFNLLQMTASCFGQNANTLKMKEYIKETDKPDAVQNDLLQQISAAATAAAAAAAATAAAAAARRGRGKAYLREGHGDSLIK